MTSGSGCSIATRDICSLWTIENCNSLLRTNCERNGPVLDPESNRRRAPADLVTESDSRRGYSRRSSTECEGQSSRCTNAPPLVRWKGGMNPSSTREEEGPQAAARAATSAGRWLRNGVAFSKASATQNRVGSWNGLPASWIATGNPPAPNPAQTEIAG